ncbi:excinuclease ABC subunit UvrC [Geobacter sp. DSM 9736]|uniref:excinuclease ABC subunit UvrC n=1 Tax=Geobacter sp. DSM 9736 TaxID=1277350 RepID=UPI000B4FF880|nr:excinuclease ABC subunit UvrC [Geobacter sp. DSM 9736]SNB47547.1 Excinuclease ABC subunit C [Geobacter sp. DSM 9736]
MITIEKTDSFPAAPGVYLMEGSDGTVLYVGKARDLKKRVRSYFSTSKDSRWHIRFLMERVASIRFIVTDTEKEALILENTLIKKHHPRYNLNLRDDKTYFSLRMDMRDQFPRLTIVRKIPRDGARYFGPYSSAAAAREVLKQLYRIFPLRHYPLETCRLRKRPCLFYQIRQCSAPCHGMISPEQYASLAEGAMLFLEGKKKNLVAIYKQRMAQAAANEEYEEAARFRDLVKSVEVTLEKQKMVTQGGDMDVLGFCHEANRLEIALLFIRGGTVIGSRNYSLAWELDDGEGIASFLAEYYSKEVYIPEEVLVPIPLDEPEALADYLSEKRGKKVTVHTPRKGSKLEIVQLATKNARNAAQEKAAAAAGSEAVLQELKERLRLEGIPRRIECYDISNTQGRLAVGSRVSFFDGKADKTAYRHYRIRSLDQPDDFGMMREVLARRFNRTEEEGLPDLIIVDGGIGQLNILLKVLEDLGIQGVHAASLAKSRVERGIAAHKVSRSDERIFLPGRKNPLILRQNSAPLLLLARIRDEAHRFAITYHKKLRGKAALASKIDEIPGVGPVRRKALLNHFGSLSRLEQASLEELAAVSGMTRRAAEALWVHFHKEKEEPTDSKNKETADLL